jgi:FkbM family methyltransferase
MKKENFSWLYRQTKDKRTKLILKKLEKRINIKQKSSLRIGKWKIWLNKENPFLSLKTYSDIFKEKDHTILPNFPSKNDSTIIDLGANEGFYTLKVKEKAPKSKIIAVEPNPIAFKILKKNIEANKLKNVMAVNKAVTSKSGKIVFEIVKDKTTIGALKVYKKYRKRGKLRKIIVNSITLEKLCRIYKINNIDLLKIDVEGGELDILKNSENILSKIKKAVVEYHRAQKTRRAVKKIMLKNNFRILLVDAKRYYGDIYFIRSD